MVCSWRSKTGSRRIISQDLECTFCVTPVPRSKQTIRHSVCFLGAHPSPRACDSLLLFAREVVIVSSFQVLGRSNAYRCLLSSQCPCFDIAITSASDLLVDIHVVRSLGTFALDLISDEVDAFAMAAPSSPSSYRRWEPLGARGRIVDPRRSRKRFRRVSNPLAASNLLAMASKSAEDRGSRLQARL